MCTHYPFFALLLASFPYLWRTWIFRSGCRSHQIIATSFAINIWRREHSCQRHIPVHISARAVPVRVQALLSYIPKECYPFIQSVALCVHRHHYNTINVRDLLSRLPTLRDFDLGIHECTTAFDTTPVPPPQLVMTRPVVALVSQVTSITLSGIFFTKVDLGQSIFRTVRTLRLTNLTRSHRYPSAFDLLLACPELQEFVAHCHWLSRRATTGLFALPSAEVLQGWSCGLRELDVQGDRVAVGPFVEAVLTRAGVRMSRFRATLFCYNHRREDLFQEVPVFGRKLVNRAESVVVDLTSFSATQRWKVADGSYTEWGVKWQMCDLRIFYWVRRLL